MRILRRVLGLAFIAVGILHFARPKFFLAIMPPDATACPFSRS